MDKIKIVKEEPILKMYKFFTKRAYFYRKGFTLLELLVVIAIVAILVGAIMPMLSITSYDAKVTKVRNDLEAIKKAAYLLHSETDYWPPAVDCGCGFVRDPIGSAGPPIPGWNGPYLEDWKPDPWGNNYILYDEDIDGKTTRFVKSKGADGQDGGTGANADISLMIISDIHCRDDLWY